MSQQFITYCLQWLSTNSIAFIVVLIVITPILAITVMGYMVHVLGKAVDKKK